jgi:hypothetical protein
MQPEESFYLHVLCCWYDDTMGLQGLSPQAGIFTATQATDANGPAVYR